MKSFNSTNLEIPNNILVTVPSSPTFMTTFILMEQGDWFEDEMDFVRKFVKPGMKVIDIGANYGLYTLSMARNIGDTGKVWAFEPTESTAQCLKESIANNNFHNIKLVQAGLSNKTGTAKFFTSNNAELNSLSCDESVSNQSETISLLTLDYCRNDFNWDSIDFIKLDAEGEESNILKKGRRTLELISPLIMYELKHGSDINLPLINKFESMGYNSYRLIPAFNVLIPFNKDDSHDGYLLNLFCCKDSTSASLEDEGIIVKKWKAKNTVNNEVAIEYIREMPYSKKMEFTEIGNDDVYLSILNSYISIAQAKDSAEKIGFLMDSFNTLRRVLENGEKRIERLVTFSRIAFDVGERALGVKLLRHLIDIYNETANYELHEPFLPASNRYDEIVPSGDLSEWLLASIIEAYVTKSSYSSYFSNESMLPYFEKLESMGYMEQNMRRRFNLLRSISV